MPHCFCDPRLRTTTSTAETPLPNRCIPVAAFSKSTDALGIVPPTPKLNIFMRHLQRTRTPSANFWAVSQAKSARNATQRRRFPRSEKPTANDPRRKPPRSPGSMAKSAPISCETVQNPRGRDRGQGRGSRKRQCGRASDIAGSCPQARPQQPPAPTANGTPAATWAHPCSKNSHIGG